MTARIILLLIAFIAGCSANGPRIDRLARSAGLESVRVQAGAFPLVIYMKGANTDGRLFVFLEGDGIPWRGGVTPSTDPTTRKPVALELLIQSPARGAYITRPCYQGQQTERCSPELWTSARYSQEIIDSMATAVRDAMRRAGAKQVVLVGYSGGGALAVLTAERLEQVAAVITLSANLDTDAWTAHHRYLPLTGSLNPARSEREHPWPELHLQGAHDRVVPPATTAAYFDRYPSAGRRVIDNYDHVCCWARDWERLVDEATKQLVATDR